MAGIIANTSSVTIGSGVTSADNSQSGYITDEQVSLSVTPSASTGVAWSLSKPTSSTARAALVDATASSTNFTPDVAGEYVVSAVVDSTTTYTLRMSVTQVATSSTLEALRFAEKIASAVSAPNTGIAVFADLTSGHLLEKHPGGILAMHGDVGSVGANLTDAAATIQIGEGARRTLPASTLTANRAVTLGTTNAEDGDVITIVRLDATAFTLTLTNGGGGGGTVDTLPVSERRVVRAKFDGTDWYLHDVFRL
jgi:hypothetical protein